MRFERFRKYTHSNFLDVDVFVLDKFKSTNGHQVLYVQYKLKRNGRVIESEKIYVSNKHLKRWSLCPS